MSDSPFIVDVTHKQFSDLVLQKSHDIPVLVDFWAAWCAPCRMLMPLLAKLAEEYQGKFMLTKVNTDSERELAAKYGIRSLPTVKLFRKGVVAGELMGVQPESTIRALIDRHIPRRSDTTVDRALEVYRYGKTTEAIDMLRSELHSDPVNDRIKTELARMLLSLPTSKIETTDLGEGERLLNSLSVKGASSKDAAALRARLIFLQVAADAPTLSDLQNRVATDSSDLEARYQLSARQMLAGEYQLAIEQLLEIVRRNRAFREDAARKALVNIFNLIGNDDPLVHKYRKLLSSAIN